jgi:hypothetical protein
MVLEIKYKKFALVIDAILRISAVSLMWWNILLSFVVNGLLDAIDGDILGRLGVSRTSYQKYDKLLDFWWQIGILVYIVTRFEKNYIWWMLITLFAIRSIGIALYTITNTEWLLFAFPNVFNCLFFLVIAFPGLFRPTDYSFYLALFGLMVFTFWKEWALHVDKIDMTHFLIPWIHPKVW